MGRFQDAEDDYRKYDQGQDTRFMAREERKWEEKKAKVEAMEEQLREALIQSLENDRKKRSIVQELKELTQDPERIKRQRELTQDGAILDDRYSVRD